MIRLARWEHTSDLHLLIAAVAAVLIGFTSFIGSMHLARCAWRRRHTWIKTLRRAVWNDRPRMSADEPHAHAPAKDHPHHEH